MNKTWPVIFVIAILIIGCATPKTEAEKRREAFRLSRVPQTHQSAFLKANDCISAGDNLYFEARETRELKARSYLLHSAASNYRKAIVMLRKIHEEIEDTTDKGYIVSVLKHTESSLQETVRMLPIFEE